MVWHGRYNSLLWWFHHVEFFLNPYERLTALVSSRLLGVTALVELHLFDELQHLLSTRSVLCDIERAFQDVNEFQILPTFFLCGRGHFLRTHHQVTWAQSWYQLRTSKEKWIIFGLCGLVQLCASWPVGPTSLMCEYMRHTFSYIHHPQVLCFRHIPDLYDYKVWYRPMKKILDPFICHLSCKSSRMIWEMQPAL